MRVLLLGGGGREHALAWALADSPLMERLLVAPGNPGIAEVAECVAVDPQDFDQVAGLARREDIDLVVPGPEGPLVQGIVDRLENEGIPAFGPGVEAARLEGSKAFTRTLAQEAGIPMAEGATFTRLEDAERHVRALGAPIVIKADGLAAGKGVTVAETVEEALEATRALFGGRFGEAGARVVVEERLEGTEASLFAVSDGQTAVRLADAQDYKRVGEGDQGPNTGGMGACSPAPAMTDALRTETMERIIVPAVDAMRRRGTPYRGVLYAGLMLTASGPRLIEFNVRFGDPECQVLMHRLHSDLVPMLMAARDGELSNFDLRFRTETAVCVVMCAQGYPGSPVTGTRIRGLREAAAQPGVEIFHAGTRREGRGVVTGGGRVIGVSALGAGLEEARSRAYAGVDRIHWDGAFCRRDIAASAGREPGSRS